MDEFQRDLDAIEPHAVSLEIWPMAFERRTMCAMTDADCSIWIRRTTLLERLSYQAASKADGVLTWLFFEFFGRPSLKVQCLERIVIVEDLPGRMQ